jgi:hypothetical protein
MHVLCPQCSTCLSHHSLLEFSPKEISSLLCSLNKSLFQMNFFQFYTHTHTHTHIYTYITLHIHSIDPSNCHMALGYKTSHNTIHA